MKAALDKVIVNAILRGLQSRFWDKLLRRTIKIEPRVYTHKTKLRIFTF